VAVISKTLNDEGVQARQAPRTRAVRAWCPSSIREMLRNERYRGVQVWNRTEKACNPETGRKVSKRDPSRNGSAFLCQGGALFRTSFGQPFRLESEP